MAESVKVSTFWVSVGAAIVVPAIAQYVTIQSDITIIAERQGAVMTKLDKMEENLYVEIIGRTNDRFTSEDWQREEARLNAKYEKLEQQIKKLSDAFYSSY